MTNHLTHKPGGTIEVDWSGPTMSILTTDGEKIKVYLFVATLPYSQYSQNREKSLRDNCEPADKLERENCQ